MYQSRWADPPPPEAAPSPAQQVTEASSQPETITSPRPTTSSGLSAAAPSFAPSSPSAPPPDISTIDEFAQTGAQQDDLFDDVIPVQESMQTRPPDELFGDEFTPVEKPVVIQQPVVDPPKPQQPQQQQQSRARGDGQRGKGRARGRGRVGGPDNTRKDSQTQPPAPIPQSSEPQSQPPDNAPTGPSKVTAPSVRGNRQATGGVRKPKLTAAELEQKMASISLKNASLTEAHARAEADAASFAERESQAQVASAQRAKEERRDRQQMMGERERNRMRKLKAMEGREWDMEKQEDDFSKGGKFDSKGFAGDKEGYTDGREYLYREPRGGRGGGGGRGGAGRGRVGESVVPRKEDFPALPEKAGVKDTSSTGTAAAGKSSWADQVESATPS